MKENKFLLQSHHRVVIHIQIIKLYSCLTLFGHRGLIWVSLISIYTVLFLIEIQMIQSVILVSGILQSDSIYTNIYKYIPICIFFFRFFSTIFFFRFFSTIIYYKILNVIPYAVEQDLIVYLFYIQQFLFANHKLLIYPLGSISGLGRSPGKGNGNPLQEYCLENPMDRGAWQATVHGVAKSRTRLSNFTSLHFHVSTLVIISLFSMSMSLFLLCRYVHLYHFLRFHT